jgi:hypothetical protein
MSPERVEELVRRVAERFRVEAYKRPKNMVPVWNKDKERTVYVLPETMKEEGGKYEKLPDNELDSQGKPTPLRHPGQPQLPKKPQKPHKPQIKRKPVPAPLHPPLLPIERRNLPPKKPKAVPHYHVKPPKVPHPPNTEDFKRVRRNLKADDAVPERVLQKFLDEIQFSGV